MELKVTILITVVGESLCRAVSTPERSNNVYFGYKWLKIFTTRSKLVTTYINRILLFCTFSDLKECGVRVQTAQLNS